MVLVDVVPTCSVVALVRIDEGSRTLGKISLSDPVVVGASLGAAVGKDCDEAG